MSQEMSSSIRIAPQPGPQEEFCSSEADIVIYGGAAGGGKSYGLLIEPLRHLSNHKFRGVIFRKTSVDIRKQGSLLEASKDVYYKIGGGLNDSRMLWRFPTGSSIQLAHMQHEKNKLDWQGAELPFIGFDELTHFSKSQFFYMLSRNRSTSGVSGYVRATCNPDADSWVAEFISWWIDWDTGYPIQERSGKIRYFVRAPDDRLLWGSNPQECLDLYEEKHGKPEDEIEAKSVTFIAANIYDNQILLEKDPSYLKNLNALSLVERERLKKGNWKIKASAGKVFKRGWFEVKDAAPSKFKKIIRYWDRAATEKEEDNDPDWTVGMKLAIDYDDVFWILDVHRFRYGPYEVEKEIKATASQDGNGVTQWLQTDPGQAGKYEKAQYAKVLKGFPVKFDPVPRTSKPTRADAASAQAGAGNIKLLRGEWNDDFLTEAVNFPDGAKDDQIDTLAGGVQVLTGKVSGDWTDDIKPKKSKTMAGSLKDSTPKW